jgi:glycosyltransferase involved in cell wall biosynthesis
MRVNLVCLNYPPEPTGVAVYTGALADDLAERGVDVRVITGVPHYPQWRVYDGYGKGRTEIRDGLTVTRRRHPVPVKPQVFNRLGMELTFGLKAAITRCNASEIVVLVNPALFSSILVALKAALCRRPVVVWVQDIYSLAISETGRASPLASRLVASAERGLLNRVQAVVVIHDRFKRHLVTQLGVDPDKVSVIRNWCHIDEASPLTLNSRAEMRQHLGWRDDVTVLLHAGNMGAKQGLGNLVEASRIADQADAPVLFVLMGAGSQRAELEAMGSNRCLQIIDPLPSESFSTALHAADALLINERGGVTEMSVPSKLTSYFATGLPVIAATDSGSVTAEEIEASGAGIRVDADKPELIVMAAMELRNNPQQARALGKKGLEFRRSHLNADSSLDSFHQLLSKLVVNSSHGRQSSNLDGPSPATEEMKGSHLV